MRKHFVITVGIGVEARALDRIHNVFGGTVVHISEKDHNTNIYWYVDATKILDEVDGEFFIPTKWHYEWPEWYKEGEAFEFWKGVGVNDS